MPGTQATAAVELATASVNNKTRPEEASVEGVRVARMCNLALRRA
jgi:hypothetical protein